MSDLSLWGPCDPGDNPDTRTEQRWSTIVCDLGRGGGGGFHSNRPTEAKSLGPHLLHPEVTVSNVKGPQEWSRKAHGRGTGLSWPEPAEVAGLVAKKYLRRHRISLGF